jgi:hypothetical protein
MATDYAAEVIDKREDDLNQGFSGEKPESSMQPSGTYPFG